jgi:hypothetical protein
MPGGPQRSDPIFTRAPSLREPLNLRCPRCARDDAVQKVSAIHAAGIQHSSSVTHGVIAGGISSTYGSPGALLASNLSSTRGSTQSGISLKLGPPPEPRVRSSLGWALLGMLIGGLCGLGLVASSPPVQAGQVPGLLIAVLAAVLVGSLMWLMANAAAVRVFDQLHPKWEREIAAWNKFYYCARDDVVFEPGSDKAAPAEKLMDGVNLMAGVEED